MSRISAESKVNNLQIELDINTEIYPVQKDECYSLVLASSVNADGSDNFDIIQYETQGSSAAAGGMGALIDQYDYVMNGKIFQYKPGEDDKTM